MYLVKSLFYAVGLFSTASTVLSAPVVVQDVAEDLVLRGYETAHAYVYSRMADNDLVIRDGDTDLPHPKSKYCKIRRWKKGCGIFKRSEFDAGEEVSDLAARVLTKSQATWLKATHTKKDYPGSKKLDKWAASTGASRKDVKTYIQRKVANQRATDKKRARPPNVKVSLLSPDRTLAPLPNRPPRPVTQILPLRHQEVEESVAPAEASGINDR
ncbi:hypothetical protein FA13DRAFT_1714430 [Coprinellus micaceus]|uniref:Uncharacterized protein n=1 Tax=Coprinellus micaceus TaxID=71717 RepID=A0A4Y7SSE2_COPMI|nr:hypothetical protein FA13DRAFT_1714430 [Coprinellus micaceus]